MPTRHLIWLHARLLLWSLDRPDPDVELPVQRTSLHARVLGGRRDDAGHGDPVPDDLAILGRDVPAAASTSLPVGAVAPRSSTVWLQMSIFFLYTGLEVTFSQWTYTVLTESRHFGARTAGLAVGVYWGCLGAGRVLSGFIADRVESRPAVAVLLRGGVDRSGAVGERGLW